jgi:adenylosuccinate lyase
MIIVLSNLEVSKEKMKKNISLTEGRTMSEAIMISLTKKGMNRQKAHEIIRKLTIKSITEKKSFKKAILNEKKIKDFLSEVEIEEAIDPKNYIGTSVEQIDYAIKKTLEERRKRGLL